MATVSVTALYMGIYRIAWAVSSEPGATSFAWFLIFISILSGATAWYGVRVLRFKKRRTSHRYLLDLLFPVLLLISSLGVMIYGWTIKSPLIQYFPIVGFFLGGTQLKYWITVTKISSHWVVEHIIGMLSCSIATITAFTVFGAPRLLHLQSANIFMWLLPTIIFVPLIIVLTNYYGRKFSAIQKE